MRAKKKSFEDLRQTHPIFIYENFAWETVGEDLRVRFKFRTLPDLVFEPEITIKGAAPSIVRTIPERVIENLCFHLGLVEMLSYWKATCAQQILIQAGFLSDEQIAWWKDLLTHGMGEYFFVNDIDFTSPDFVSISVDHKQEMPQETYGGVPAGDRALVLTSGGKDTALTLSIFSSEGLEFGSLMLNPARTALNLASSAGVAKPLIIYREIDPRLLELNRKGYLNGHTPFSAYLAFLGVTCAVLLGYNDVVVSNERSSDEGNVQFLGREINHQYSKTLRFERKFQEYTARYLAKEVTYFSFLRPLYDIQIMGLLASYPKVLSIFKSCNKNQKLDTWCGRCPKCLSVYTMLYPFAGRDTAVQVFGRELFEEAGNIKIVQELAGVTGHKPFECVGTQRETAVGLYLGLQRAKEIHNGKLPSVWHYVETEVLPHYTNLQELVNEVLFSWGGVHCLPPRYELILKRYCERIVEEQFSHETY